VAAETAPPVAPGTIFTCPMHPEIRQVGPGSCPICGMALEPAEISLDDAKCDMIATGIVEASKNLKLSVPLVVRLEGTNVDLGKKILAESGLAIIAADNLADAAQKVVAAVKKGA